MTTPPIPYPVLSKYVSVPCDFSDGGQVVPIMEKSKYDLIAGKLQQASHVTIGYLEKRIAFDRLPREQKKNTPDPWEKLAAEERKVVGRELTGASLENFCHVHKDMQSGRAGYKTPVYSVNGRPTLGTHSDKNGQLSSTVARLSGVALPAAPKR